MESENKLLTKSDKKILLVESDFINSFMLKQYLENDFKMLYARDSQEVVKIMNEHFIDLVLLNTEYDNFGMTAADLVKFIKDKDQQNQIKIMALPNHQNDSISIKNELDVSLTKNYSKDEIIKNIGKLLNDRDEKNT